MYHLLVSAVLIISCCTPSLGRYLGHTPYRPQPYNPYRNYHYPSPIGYPYHMPTSYYPAGTYFDQRRGILRPFPGGGVPIIVDYHKRCTGNYVGLKPHPEEGQYYYVCKQDCVIFGRCQKYQKFNTTCGQCVQQTPTEYEPKCTAEGRFPIHYDCHLYYKCDKSMQPQVYSCPHNMIFSQQTSKCIPGNRCIPTQIVSDDDSVPEYCENKYPACQQNGVFRSPSDCSLYYTCELQENRVFYQTRFKCPGDTFYDLQNNACLPREQVPCDCITLAELVYPPSYMQPYPPLIQPYPIVHDSEFDLDSLEEIEHATESSSEEDDEEGEELEEVDDSHEEFDDPYNSESSSSEEDASEDKKGQLAKERTTTTTVFPVATTLPTTESSAETTTETSEEQSTETTTEFATETPAAFTESPTEGPTEAATETTTEAVTEVPVEAISEVLPEVTTEAVVSTQIPESTTEAVVSTAVAADPTVAPVVSTVSPSPTDDDENDDIDILGSDVDFGDRFVLQDDKIWDNDGPGKTIFLKLNPDPESEEQTKDNEHDSTESPSDQGTLTTEPESEETTTEPSQDDNDDEDDDTGEGNNNETGTEGSNQDTDETNNEAGGDGNESGNDNHESEEDGQGSGEGNKESGEGSNEAGENATEEPDVSHTSDDTTVAPTTAIGATNQAADDGDTETEPCDEIVTDTESKSHNKTHCSPAQHQNTQTTTTPKTQKSQTKTTFDSTTQTPKTTATQRDLTTNDVNSPLHHDNRTTSTLSTPSISNTTSTPRTLFDKTTRNEVMVRTSDSSTESSKTTQSQHQQTSDHVIEQSNSPRDHDNRTSTNIPHTNPTPRTVFDKTTNDVITHKSETSTSSPKPTTTHGDPTTNDVRSQESSTLSTSSVPTTKDWLQDFETVFNAKQETPTPEPIEGEFLPLGKSHNLTEDPKEHQDTVTKSGEPKDPSDGDTTTSDGIKIPITGTEQPFTVRSDLSDFFDDDDDDEEPAVLSDEIVIPDSGTEEPHIDETPPTNVTPKLEGQSSTSKSTTPQPAHSTSPNDSRHDDDLGGNTTPASSEKFKQPIGSTEKPNFSDSHHATPTTVPKTSSPPRHGDDIKLPVSGTNEPNFWDFADHTTTTDPETGAPKELPSPRFFHPDHDDFLDDEDPSDPLQNIVVTDSGTEEPNNDALTTVSPTPAAPKEHSTPGQHVARHGVDDDPTTPAGDINIDVSGTEDPNFLDYDGTTTTTATTELPIPKNVPTVKLLDPDHDDIFDDEEPAVLSDEIVIPHTGTEEPSAGQTHPATDSSKSTTPIGHSIPAEHGTSDAIQIAASGTEDPKFTDSVTVAPGKFPPIKIIDPDHDDIFENDDLTFLPKSITIPDSGTEDPVSEVVSSVTTVRPTSTTAEEHHSPTPFDLKQTSVQPDKIKIPPSGTDEPNVPETTTSVPGQLTPAPGNLPTIQLFDPDHDDYFDDDGPAVLSDEIVLPDSGTEEPGTGDITSTTAGPKSTTPKGLPTPSQPRSKETSVDPDNIRIPIGGTDEPQFHGTTTSVPEPTVPGKVPLVKLFDPDHDAIFGDDDPFDLSDEIQLPVKGTENPGSNEPSSSTAGPKPSEQKNVGPGENNTPLEILISGTDEPSFADSDVPDIVTPQTLPSVKLFDPDHDDIFEDDDSTALFDEIAKLSRETETPRLNETPTTTIRPKLGESKDPTSSIRIIDPDHEPAFDEEDTSVPFSITTDGDLNIDNSGTEEPTFDTTSSATSLETPSTTERSFTKDATSSSTRSTIDPLNLHKSTTMESPIMTITKSSPTPQPIKHIVSLSESSTVTAKSASLQPFTTTPSTIPDSEEDETGVLSDEIVIPLHFTNSPSTTPTPRTPPPTTTTTTSSENSPPITHSRSTAVQTTPTPTPKYLETTQTNNNRSEFSLHFRSNAGCATELGQSLLQPAEQQNIYISLLNLDTNKPVNNTNSTITQSNNNQNTVKPPPCETEKANMPRLEIFVERPMDVRFVICPKSCTKDHKHNYDEQDNRAVHLKWYPNRSNQSMTLETSNRLKIDG